VVRLSEDFAGGFFGFGRTYGASLRLECASAAELASDWPAGLVAASQWRERRKDQATALHVLVQASTEWLWDAVAFLKMKVLVPPGKLDCELQGLFLRIYVHTPEMEHYLYVELFPEATGKPN
jgi:hypothetical protein